MELEQWMELEHQALIYKHFAVNAPFPSSLLLPIRRSINLWIGLGSSSCATRNLKEKNSESMAVSGGPSLHSYVVPWQQQVKSSAVTMTDSFSRESNRKLLEKQNLHNQLSVSAPMDFFDFASSGSSQNHDVVPLSPVELQHDHDQAYIVHGVGSSAGNGFLGCFSLLGIYEGSSWWSLNDNNNSRTIIHPNISSSKQLLDGMGISSDICNHSNGWIRPPLLCIYSTIYGNMLHCILRAPMSFFDSTPTGKILNRVSADLIL